MCKNAMIAQSGVTSNSAVRRPEFWEKDSFSVENGIVGTKILTDTEKVSLGEI